MYVGKESIEANHKKFAEVATLLNWSESPHGTTWGAHFTNQQGETYSCSWHKDHYTVRGERPEQFNGLGCSSYDIHLEQTEASISTTKPVDRIAKEITRRVCEPYAAMYREMLERIEATKNYNLTVQMQANHLAMYLQTSPRGIGDPNVNVTVVKSFNMGSTRIEATVYQDSVNWKLSIPHDLSRKIAELISKHYQQVEVTK